MRYDARTHSFIVDAESDAALESSRYEWARRVVAQHLGPGLEALWQAAMAHRDLGVHTQAAEVTCAGKI